MVELLSPARDLSVGLAAIRHGADAVYIGAPSHGARAAAACTVDDIRTLAEYAHKFNARVYVTLNTLIYPDEIAEVERMVWALYRAGVDALIIQDMALLRMKLPPIALHASTQCDTRTVEKAQMLERAGFSQIVLARELSIEEIAEIHRKVDVPLEVFIHGALCVCVSGDCRASLLATGRSGNRGECAQVCRYSFDLIDGDGNTIVRDKHLLSLRDMNRSAVLAGLIEAGASSLKIEGRLKEAPYVKNITGYYHRLLAGMGVERTSCGKVELQFEPDPERTFTRGYTDYFAHGPVRGMASINTPKSQGQWVATVRRSNAHSIEVEKRHDLHNGDGLCYFDEKGRFHGFRLNRVEGNRLFPASAAQPMPGTRIYRNADHDFMSLLARDNSATRSIQVKLTLRPLRGRLALDAECERGCRVTVTAEADTTTAARTPQLERRRDALLKMTGIYDMAELDDRCGNLFIPVSVLSGLRQAAAVALDRARAMTYRFDYRRQEDAALETPERLSFHDNVANPLAERFYRDHGTRAIEPALEVQSRMMRPQRVMTCRYCLRRELGRCLRTPQGRQWKEPLTLVSGPNKFALDFDCRECRMHVDIL